MPSFPSVVHEQMSKVWAKGDAGNSNIGCQEDAVVEAHDSDLAREVVRELAGISDMSYHIADEDIPDYIRQRIKVWREKIK